MKVNFEIVDNYALSYNGVHIDLHNNFDFSGYQYSIEQKQLKLFWNKCSGDWVAENELAGLTLIHSNISYLDIAFDLNGMEIPGDDDKCLSDISFFPSANRKTNCEFTTQNIPNLDDDIIYLFESGHFFRIKCELIELVIN